MIITPTLSFALSLALAAVTTIGTLGTVGIGFLTRPSRATLYWSFAFVLAMTAMFAVAAGEAVGSEVLRRAGMGALMGAPGLLWSGFRARWGLRPFVACGPIVAVISATVLALPALDPWYFLLYRGAFLAAAVFAGLFVIDWVRDRTRRSDPLTAPLAAASIAFVLLGIGVAATWLSPAPGMRDLELARVTSSVGMLAYVTCAAAAVIAVSTRSARAARKSESTGDWVAFQRLAKGRLRDRQLTDEPVSLLLLTLDDVEDIRRSSGSRVVSRLTRTFVAEVRAAFPGDSLIGSPRPGSAVALVDLGESEVRERLRMLLERIPLLDVDGRLPIHPSASAGWAPSSVVGFDLDALYYMAQEASLVASQDGGDRWERVGAAVTARILSGSARL